MIYLSVDLDFWEKAFPQKYFDALTGLGVPRRLVVSHEKLLPHINQQEFDTLVNVDFHSDIAGLEKNGKRPVLNDGTWGSHVRKSEQRRFVWSCPNKATCVDLGRGLCHGIPDDNPFRHPEKSGWQQTSIRQRWFPPWRRVAAVGVAISPAYAEKCVLNQFYEWLRYNYVYFSLDREAATLVKSLRKGESYESSAA